MKSAFFPQDFLSSVAGATEMLLDGVPFESLSFLYPPPTHFFDLKFLMENRPFFRPRFFILTDGWDGMDGTDGRMVGPLFFFAHILKTT